ncbi:Chondroitin synthase [Botrimarina colliarenosi]|uniref:Chondroitin synthase n=1 Tax=Botrimarina colliarenosi TaxID=2528001 RepID=A0A5C6A949_9BACT|nr:glycosyltransferase family A protein [Botrimarina colliarenosi]TWT95838.1 Chondroitin synthase [Botrimarina colliarenosi]
MSNPTTTGPLSPVDVTVVVGSYNRAAMLAETIESLTALDTSLPGGGEFTYEIVAIDNASTDETQEVIRRFAASERIGSAERVRGFYEAEPGVTHARNRGLAESVGEWIAFHDDDQRAHPLWLAKLQELARRRNVKVVGGAVHLSLPVTNTRKLAPACRVLLGEKVGWTEEQPYTRKRIPGTNNLMLHRSVLQDVGVFDVRIKDGGEDADLYRRIRTAGYEAWYTPEAIVYHLIPEQRLAAEYMKWTATRHGQHLALREYKEWGRAKLAGMIALRAVQAGGSYLPRYFVAIMSGQREKALGKRALLWRSQAYLARAWSLVRKGDADTGAQDASLNLREGREKLIHGAANAN